MYNLYIKPHLDKILNNLSKKNPNQIEIIYKKIKEIVKDPHRYKNLKSPLNNWKRVHIDRHFVLTFSVDEKTKTVVLEDYEHHDKIYKT